MKDLESVAALLGVDVENDFVSGGPLSEELADDELALSRLADDGCPLHGD